MQAKKTTNIIPVSTLYQISVQIAGFLVIEPESTTCNKTSHVWFQLSYSVSQTVFVKKTVCVADVSLGGYF